MDSVKYSAESVISALKANNTLICEGIDEVRCPSPKRHEGCADPVNCDLCRKHRCKQPVIVRGDNYIKLGILFFKFRVSPQNDDGFIPKEDSAFKLLQGRKLIKEGPFEEVHLSNV